MRVWRISNHEDLSGRGGLLFAGRWNRLGTPIVYTADHPATAMLETLVHLEWDRVPETYKLIQINLPDDSSSYRVDAADLPTAWRTDPHVTQANWDGSAQAFGAPVYLRPFRPGPARVERAPQPAACGCRPLLHHRGHRIAF